MRKFLKEFRVELIALLVVLLGVFLLIEQFDIRITVYQFLEQLVISINQFIQFSKERLWAYFRSFTLSDLLGWILIIGTLIFVAWRARYRFLRSDYWRSRTCPKCGSSLERIPRKRVHHILSKTLLFQGRRYKCSNPECNWTGMRHRHRIKRSDHEVQQFPPEGKVPFL
jgi:hypothetical protein